MQKNGLVYFLTLFEILYFEILDTNYASPVVSGFEIIMFFFETCADKI